MGLDFSRARAPAPHLLSAACEAVRMGDSTQGPSTALASLRSGRDCSFLGGAAGGLGSHFTWGWIFRGRGHPRHTYFRQPVKRFGWGTQRRVPPLRLLRCASVGMTVFGEFLRWGLGRSSHGAGFFAGGGARATPIFRHTYFPWASSGTYSS